VSPGGFNVAINVAADMMRRACDAGVSGEVGGFQMRITTRLAAGAAATAIACVLAPTLALAQDVTGGITGKITDDAGKPLAHVPVTVTYEPTNTPTTTTTGADGFFSLRGLQVGGPYRVSADDKVHEAKSVEVPGIALGAPYELDFSLETPGAVQTVTVRASRTKGSIITQTGPRSTFTPTQIQELPSFSRDLKDVARLNPFVTIDPTNSDAIVIAGANNHVNTIYLDGVRQSDNFGLNNNGYPTQRSPFSIDIVKAFNVEVAPYDVQYGDFQGGLLNIVTKSGSNDFHGSGFFEYDSNELGAGQVIGASALHQPACPNGNQSGTIPDPNNPKSTVGCGDRVFKPLFKDKNYGGYLSGPIIPDRLFFFIDYEKYETTKVSGYGPSDSGEPNGVKGVTTANVNQVANILQSSYGYNAGTYGAILPIQNQDYFARLDANITDKQHLFVTYQRTDGTSLTTPNNNVNSILGLSSNFYVYEQRLETYTADLQSHWTDKLSTELEYTHQTVASPSTLLGQPFAEIQVQLPTGSYIYAGPDISRQANNLDVADEQIKAKANYTLGDHVITAGYERDMVTSSDLFVQYATGLYVFNSYCGSGDAITNLMNHQACSFTYQNAYTNNPATAGSSVENDTDTGYLQDEWHPFSNLTLKAGLRFEYYTTPDKPLFNQTFMNEYGFANNLTINGENVLMPRLGFNWKPLDGLTVYGGAGLFSGGNPIVYLYDSYDNPGNLLGITSANCGASSKPVAGTTGCSNASYLTNVNGAAIPAAAQAAVTANANAGLGNTNSLAPGFQPFQEWKASIGAIKTFDLSQHHLGDHWRVHADYLYQKTRYAPMWQDLFEEANVLPTPAPDGRPVFNPARFTSARTTGYDIVLTDTDKGYGHVFAVGLGKSWDFGLDVDYSFTYEDIKDISPATSSVALSNYSQSATADPNHPTLGTSDYETKWENKLTVSFDHKFFGDLSTKFTLFAQYRAGNPFSYTYYSNASSSTASDNLFGQTGAAAYRNDQLLYIPKADSSGNVTATSDPIVTYGPSFNVAAFNTYLHQTGLIKYAGSISPRNGFTAGAVTTADIRIEQELPAILPNKYAKLIGYFDLINVPNFLNKNWGVIYQTNFPGFISPITAQNCQLKGNSCGKGTGDFYEYDTIRTSTPAVQTPFQPPSATWAIRLGVRYQF
jgi:hypothetical protein